MRPWKDANNDPDKVARRDGATDFLKEILANSVLWDQVTDPNSSDKTIAWKMFRKYGDIDVPTDVKVICMAPDLASRDKLVLFIMPPRNTSPDVPFDPLKYWVNSWPPY
jgi:hypothetical protein